MSDLLYHETRTALVCLMCGRRSGTAVQRGRRVPTTEPLAPEHAAPVARLRCPHCGGRLIGGDTELVYAPDRSPLPDEPVLPRGRPRGSWSRTPRPPEDEEAPCVVCGRSPRARRRRVCLSCKGLADRARQRQAAGVGR